MDNMRFFTAVVALGLLTVAAWPFGQNGAGPLYGQQVMATGPFVCDGQQHEANWVNESGRTLRVRQAEMWLGMYRGGVADFWVWLSAPGAGTMGHTNWDHYADPTGLHNLRYVYAPDYVEILPGAAVTLGYGCDDVGESGAVGDVAVTLWWSR